MNTSRLANASWLLKRDVRHQFATCRLAWSLGILSLLGIPACDSGAKSAARDSVPSAVSIQPGAPNSSVTGAPVAGPVLPASVEAVGHHSENAYDMAKASDWMKARASADSLKAAVAVPTLEAGGETRLSNDLRTGVQALERAVTARDRMAGMHANHITELGARLAAGYPSQVPSDVTLLDYYGRELEIWAGANDGAKLRKTATALRRVWVALRPQVLAKSGVAEATQFDALVAEVERARTAAEYGKVATPVLDAVDKLEKVFTR